MTARNPRLIDLSRERRLALVRSAPRTPGVMLFEALVRAPRPTDVDGIHRNVNLALRTARTLLAEKRAGLWSGPLPPIRRQP